MNGYLSQAKWGLSSARNYGVERASGEWIIFVDSDDYVERSLRDPGKRD
ncbi:MAG: glycosyltransferase family A protein [Lachnospiraceae bacterium]